MKIRPLLAVLALSGSLALAACTQEASQGGGGNPYGSSGQPSSMGGSSGSMSSGSSGSMSSGGGAMR